MESRGEFTAYLDQELPVSGNGRRDRNKISLSDKLNACECRLRKLNAEIKRLGKSYEGLNRKIYSAAASRRRQAKRRLILTVKSTAETIRALQFERSTIVSELRRLRKQRQISMGPFSQETAGGRAVPSILASYEKKFQPTKHCLPARRANNDK